MLIILKIEIDAMAERYFCEFWNSEGIRVPEGYPMSQSPNWKEHNTPHMGVYCVYFDGEILLCYKTNIVYGNGFIVLI